MKFGRPPVRLAYLSGAYKVAPDLYIDYTQVPTILAKSLGIRYFHKNPAKSCILHPCNVSNVDLKRPSQPESLEAF